MPQEISHDRPLSDCSRDFFRGLVLTDSTGMTRKAQNRIVCLYCAAQGYARGIKEAENLCMGFIDGMVMNPPAPGQEKA